MKCFLMHVYRDERPQIALEFLRKEIEKGSKRILLISSIYSCSDFEYLLGKFHRKLDLSGVELVFYKMNTHNENYDELDTFKGIYHQSNLHASVDAIFVYCREISVRDSKYINAVKKKCKNIYVFASENIFRLEGYCDDLYREHRIYDGEDLSQFFTFWRFFGRVLTFKKTPNFIFSNKKTTSKSPKLIFFRRKKSGEVRIIK